MLGFHCAIYRPYSFVLMLRYCANLKAIRYESTSLNRIVADKSHDVIVALTLADGMKMKSKLRLHNAIYRLRFYSNWLIHILSLSNSHNNVASMQKNRDYKSYSVFITSTKIKLTTKMADRYLLLQWILTRTTSQ